MVIIDCINELEWRIVGRCVFGGRTSRNFHVNVLVLSPCKDTKVVDRYVDPRYVADVTDFNLNVTH